MRTSHKALPRNGRQRGVTLIELMIALVVLAILASVAIPSYRSYILRSHRAEAQSALLALAAAQEKHYLNCNTYTEELEAASDAACDERGLGFADADADAEGVQSRNGWYTVEITAADTDTFAITATATGSQARDADCTEFGIDAAGTRTAENAECWR